MQMNRSLIAMSCWTRGPGSRTGMWRVIFPSSHAIPTCRNGALRPQEMKKSSSVLGSNLRVGREAPGERIVVGEGSACTQVRQAKLVRLTPFPPQRQ